MRTSNDQTTEATEDQKSKTTVDHTTEAAVDQTTGVTVDSFDIQTAPTVNQTKIKEIEILDHRLFYSYETYRIADGTHDGKLVTEYKIDYVKLTDYYYEHFYPETWYMRLDTWSPSLIEPITSELAGQH